jgi:hypothetical protein
MLGSKSWPMYKSPLEQIFIYIYIIFGYNIDLKNTLRRQVEINCNQLITFIITGQVARQRKTKTKKGKNKYDEDESSDYVTIPVKIVGKEDMGLSFFPKRPRTTSTPLHQLMHPRHITRALLAVGPPGITKIG